MIMDDHKERLARESEDLREKLKAVLDRLSEAETALRYYANPKNYSVRGVNAECFHNVLIGDYTESDNVKSVFVAGDRARKYFEAFG